jgi:hypothetical protein
MTLYDRLLEQSMILMVFVSPKTSFCFTLPFGDGVKTKFFGESQKEHPVFGVL